MSHWAKLSSFYTYEVHPCPSFFILDKRMLFTLNKIMIRCAYFSFCCFYLKNPFFFAWLTPIVIEFANIWQNILCRFHANDFNLFAHQSNSDFHPFGPCEFPLRDLNSWQHICCCKATTYTWRVACNCFWAPWKCEHFSFKAIRNNSLYNLPIFL